MQFSKIFAGIREMRLCLAGLVFSALFLAGTGPSAQAGHSVYFAHISEHLSLDAATRRLVDKIMNKSERDVLTVFARHGIDPNAKPEFDKLMLARHELQAIERDERAQLRGILTPAQFKKYDKLIKQVHARVIKATRNDN